MADRELSSVGHRVTARLSACLERILNVFADHSRMRGTGIGEIVLGAALAVGLMFVSACAGIAVSNCDRTTVSATTEKVGNSVPRLRGRPRTIAFISGDRLWTMKEDGSAKRALTRKRFIPLDAAPAWSPDGSQIAFEALRGDYKSVIYAVNADGTGERRIGRGSSTSSSKKKFARRSTRRLA